MTAICTSVHVCRVLLGLHHLHYCSELKFSELEFTIQQLSLDVLRILNLQLQGQNCAKFHLNRFRNVWDILQNKGCVFLCFLLRLRL